MTNEENIKRLRSALAQLSNEAKHYFATGKGAVFLVAAIREADSLLADAPARHAPRGWVEIEA